MAIRADGITAHRLVRTKLGAYLDEQGIRTLDPPKIDSEGFGLLVPKSACRIHRPCRNGALLPPHPQDVKRCEIQVRQKLWAPPAIR